VSSGWGCASTARGTKNGSLGKDSRFRKDGSLALQ
jgi:hypothetical protein